MTEEKWMIEIEQACWNSAEKNRKRQKQIEDELKKTELYQRFKKIGSKANRDNYLLVSKLCERRLSKFEQKYRPEIIFSASITSKYPGNPIAYYDFVLGRYVDKVNSSSSGVIGVSSRFQYTGDSYFQFNLYTEPSKERLNEIIQGLEKCKKENSSPSFKLENLCSVCPRLTWKSKTILLEEFEKAAEEYHGKQ
jgi:hypothetical protein